MILPFVVSRPHSLLRTRRPLSALLLGVAVTALVTAPLPPGAPTGPAPARGASAVVVAAAGDIVGSCSGTSCDYGLVSNAIIASGATRVLALGDVSNNSGSASDYTTRFGTTWGRFKSSISPVPGNHDYGTSKAANYYAYFGSSAAHGPNGWYSLDVGAWHVVALNSNCSKVGGCQTGSAQEKWLKADLAASRTPCTLAFWHHPRYSSGHDGDNTFTADLYADLYAHGTDVLLSGHSHDYERFAPQNNASARDDAHGITQFVVGTGGAFFTGFGTTKPNSLARQKTAMGALILTLADTSYSWRFAPIAGKTYSDSGSASCHGSGTPAPRTVTFAPTDDATIAQASPTTTYGTASRLTVDGSPVTDSLLRFAVNGLGSCTVTGARLDLTVGSTTNDNSGRGGDVHGTTHSTWSQSNVTWNSAPAATPAVVGSLGAVAQGGRYGVDVGSLVKGEGVVTFRISNPSADGARYLSSEASSSLSPRLMLACG
jgi:hypothetical protein